MLALLRWWSAGSPPRRRSRSRTCGCSASASFRWGTILATLVSFAMFGMFFALPQYFQDVRGADPLGSGLRLLPAGRRHAGRHDRRHPPERSRGGGRGIRRSGQRAVAAGYLLMAAAMALGALHHARPARPATRSPGSPWPGSASAS